MKILIIEDEKHMAEAIQHIFKKNNYIVDLAFDGKDGLDCALSEIYDIIILDIMLPKIDGISIIRELRKSKTTTPVIMLTAKSEITDKVIGLNSGADDYLTKPFNTDELIARIKAVSRRKGEIINNTLTIGNIIFDPNTLTLYNKKRSLKLTLKESQLLELLINRKGRIISKDIIIEYIWGYETNTEDNNVEVYISLLRKKLDFLNSNCFIKTVRRVGYILSVKDV